MVLSPGVNVPSSPILCLASASPRRQELLRQIGVVFEVFPADIPEMPAPDEAPVDFVRRMALEKARTVWRLRQAQGLAVLPVLGADTCLALEGEILGKPRNRSHGAEMLRCLAGRRHDVLSGIGLITQTGEHSAVNISHVTFADISDADINRYWETDEPHDKAGGYAIQGQAAAFIPHIEGSYSGIVGLPLYELVQLLKTTGVMRA